MITQVQHCFFSWMWRKMSVYCMSAQTSFQAVRVHDLQPRMLLFTDYQFCCHGTRLFPALTPNSYSHVPLQNEMKQSALGIPARSLMFVSFPCRFPWFLQFLHRRGVSSGPRAAGDGAELCFCFWHGGQEANEEVVSYTDYELHQPAGGWDPLLWPAHLHQAPWPWQRAVLRPRPLQRHGQHAAWSLDGFWCDEYFEMFVVAKWCLYISAYVAAYLCGRADWELNHTRSFRDFKHTTVVCLPICHKRNDFFFVFL